MGAAAELVGASLHTVRPGDQHLAAARRAHLDVRVAVEQVAARHRIGTQPTTEPDDHDALLAVRELDLLARRREHYASRAVRWSPTRSEFAIAVSAGLTAPMLGKTLVSTT